MHGNIGNIKRTWIAVSAVLGLVFGLMAMSSPITAVPAEGGTLTVQKTWSGANGQTANVSARTTVSGQALDQFGTQAYTNSDGTIAWGFPWVDSEDGNAAAGRVLVTGNRLRFINLDTASISRRVDLTGVTSPATIAFDYVGRNGANTEDVIVEVSGNGTDFLQVGSFSGDTNPGGGIAIELPIPDTFVGANTTIRFRSIDSDQNWGASSYVEIDNVAVRVYTGFFGSSISTGANTDVIGSFTVTPGQQVVLAESTSGISDAVLVCSDSNGSTNVPLASTAVGIAGVYTVPGPNAGGNITCTFTNDGPIANPDLDASCGVDVTVILDESGSIDTGNAIIPTENAVRALANGLAGTGSFARFVEFSTNARDSIIGGTTAPTLVTNAYVTGPLNAYLANTSAPQNADGFEPDNDNPFVSANNNETFTNWEAGLYRAGQVPPSNYTIPPLVVFITDGNPNTIGTAGTSTNNNGGGANNAANAALEEIDAIKSAGAHVLGIGVGGASNDVSFNRLVNLIEPGDAQTWEGDGPLDIRTVDAIRVVDFADLEAALAQVASELCSHSLDITKRNQDGDPIEGRSFTTTVTGLPAGQTNSFNFIDPAGDDGPPSATDPTDANGSANFQWTPVGEVPTPADWTSAATFTEQLPPGWTLPSTPGTCTVNPGRNGISDVPLSATVDQNGLATFTLGNGQGGAFVFAAGDTVSCTITNIEPGRIRVVKQTDPAGADEDFTFTPTGWNGGATFDLNPTVDGGAFLSGDLAAGGTYSVAETGVPAGWAETNAICDRGTKGAIEVVPGEVTTCTFTNTEAASITVEKQTLPFGDPQEFTFTTSFGIAAPDDGIIGDGESFTSVDLAPGTYTISETVPAGWNLTNVSCPDVDPNTPGTQVTVTAGQDVTCVFTNTKNGTLVVKKATVGGDETFGFTGAVTGEITTDGGITADGDELSASVVPGLYAVTESAPPVGWDLTGATCSDNSGALAGSTLSGIDVAAGETVTCTFTNTRRFADLVLQKQWIDGESGDTATLQIDGIESDTQLVTSAGTIGSEIETATADTVIYAGETVTISETLGIANVATYRTTLECDNGNGFQEVSLNDDLEYELVVPASPVDTTCRFINEAERGTIVIVKSAVGGVDTFAYEGDWAGLTNGEFQITTSGAGATTTGTAVFQNVLVGDYGVTEVDPSPFWDLTTLTCTDSLVGGIPSAPQLPTLQSTGTINLDDGETVTCTYTNTRRGTITVVKDVTNTATGFAPDAFEFDGTLGTFMLRDDGVDPTGDNAQTFGNLVPGNFDIVETNANGGGFTLVDIDCGTATLGQPGPDDGVQVQLRPGQNVTCTFTNEAQAELTIDKDVISLPQQPVVVDADSLRVSYDVTVTNDGPGQIEYDLTDTPDFGPGVTIDAITVTSSDPVLDLSVPAPADGAEFTIIEDQNIAGGTTHTYRVTVEFTVTADMTIADRGCSGPNTGTYNSATIEFDGGPLSADDCVAIPRPEVTIVKDVASGPDRNLDGTYTVIYSIDVTNAAGAGVGFYDLSDTPDFSQGVTIEELNVSNTAPGSITTNPSFGTGDNSIVAGETIAQGVTHTYQVTAVISLEFESEVTYVECGPDSIGPGEGLYNSATVTVDGEEISGEICTDLPGDLEIEKTDGDITVIAGGAPFTYTLTITNVGGVSTGSPVIVTDRLPAEFEWVSYPDEDGTLPFCAPNDINPEFLDCEIDPALVDVGGKSTTIELTARARAGIDPSTIGYENLSYVDSPDDPAPEAPECPPAGQDGFDEPNGFDAVSLVEQLVQALLLGNPDNNVACDTTPVIDGEIEVTKTDSVDDAGSVVNGQTFSYELLVTNTGTSPLGDVALSDDLPDGLTLVSVVAGAGWTCNSVDPIACTYGPVLEAGVTAPAITVDVRVSDSFVGAEITNRVDVSGVVSTPDDSKTVTGNDTEVTPLEPTLDLTEANETCVGDAPWIEFDIVAKGFVPVGATPVSIRVLDAQGDPVDYNRDGVVDDDDVITNLPLDGRILWPGASIVDGETVDWPGWVFVNGLWIEDGTDRFLRDGLFLEVSVNPTGTTALIPYPAATSECADPEQARADLQIVKTADNAAPEVGEDVNFALVVTNNGPDLATGVVVTDNVPSTLSVKGVSSSDFSCTLAGNNIRCTRSELAVGASGRIFVTASGSDPGSVTNVARVTGRQPDPNPSNNVDDATVTITQVQVLPPVPPLPPQPLPQTGSSFDDLLRLALLAVAAGLGLVVVTIRRRRNEEQVTS